MGRSRSLETGGQPEQGPCRGGWWAALSRRGAQRRLARTRQPGWLAADYKRQ